MALFPFIFFDREAWNRLSEYSKNNSINHETIHLRQQIELLIIPFYLWYGIEWIIKFFRYGKRSYYNLGFEREAVENEKDNLYLCNRKFWAFLKYIKR